MSESMLFDGETIEHEVRPSWWNWARSGFVMGWWGRKKVKYLVTDKRVVECRGIFGTETDEINLDDVRQVQTEASWRGDHHGVGDILLYDTHSYNEDESVLELCGVPNYQEIANTIRKHAGGHDE